MKMVDQVKILTDEQPLQPLRASNLGRLVGFRGAVGLMRQP